MASKTERAVVNAAGLVQGIVLVTFPALSTIFTSKSDYGLSSSQYGAMFLPLVVLAIAALLLGAGLARRSRRDQRGGWKQPVSHKMAIGLTGEPVPVGSRSGAMMHRNDQRPAAAHAWASSVNCR